MSPSYLFLVWAHVVAAVAWVGGMLFLSLVLAPLVRSRAAAPDFAALFRTAARRFRFVVWISLAVLAGTGPLLLNRRGLSLFDTQGWPSILPTKLGLVALLVALTVTHDLVLGPRVREVTAIPESVRSLWERVLMSTASWVPRISLLLALAVLATAIILGRS